MNLSTPLSTAQGPRFRPVAFSMALHAGALALVVFGPEAAPGDADRGVYQQVFAPNERKLVWYRFDSKLPEVSPIERRGPSLPLRAEVRSHQEIAIRQDQGRHAKQMTWSPAPRVQVNKDLDAPNLLAFESPRVQPPPRRKLFVPPAPAVAQTSLTLDSAPELQAVINPSNPFPPAARPVRPFTPPPTRLRAASAALELAPLTQVPVSVANLAAPPVNVNRPFRQFTPPAAVTAAAAQGIELAPLPQTPVNVGGVTPLPLTVDRPVRAFTPPRASRVPGHAAGTAMIESDGPDLPATGANLNAALIGLNPPARLDPVIPDSARAATLSAGPSPSPSGGDGEPVESARVFVPGVMIRGGARDARPTLIARAIAPTSPEALAAATRPLPAQSTLPTAQRAPVPGFEGREVYTLAMQAANVTSYSGSWMLWFAARDETSVHGEVQAPFPVRKVDPVYAVSAMDERVEGTVRLAAVIRRDGHVDFVTLLRGRDERLDRGAIAALRKWEFAPARRNGEPIDVDVVVDIPFRLAPLGKR